MGEKREKKGEMGVGRGVGEKIVFYEIFKYCGINKSFGRGADFVNSVLFGGRNFLCLQRFMP